MQLNSILHCHVSLYPGVSTKYFLLIAGNIRIVMLMPLLKSSLTDFPVLTMPLAIMTWLAFSLADVPSTVSSAEASELILCGVSYVKISVSNYIKIYLLSSFSGGVIVMPSLALNVRKH
ncbi:hypothetical protein I3A70_14090 [Salmonella enterica]|nr:hypothetical protein [Salmonella enterica]